MCRQSLHNSLWRKERAEFFKNRSHFLITTENRAFVVVIFIQCTVLSSDAEIRSLNIHSLRTAASLGHLGLNFLVARVLSHQFLSLPRLAWSGIHSRTRSSDE